jgi:predicted nucleic acid-binding protein
MPRTPPPARPLYVAEPPAVWRSRPPLVIDCSVVVASLFEEADAQPATQALGAHALHAPALLPFEFANVARSKSRAGAPEQRVASALRLFDELRIELHPVPVEPSHGLAMRHGLTAYDAAYLAVAALLQAPLLTLDRKLAEAAQRVLGAPE